MTRIEGVPSPDDLRRRKTGGERPAGEGGRIISVYTEDTRSEADRAVGIGGRILPIDMENIKNVKVEKQGFPDDNNS